MTNTAIQQSSARRRAVITGSALALAMGIAVAPVATAQGSLGAGVLGTAAAAPAAEAPAAAGPTITLSETSFPAEGVHEVVVTGTGFNDPGVVGARPPLQGLNAGAYVVFGKFADEWKPSEQAPSEARKNSDQRWVLPEESANAPLLAGNPQVVVVDEDGNFEATLTVSRAAADAEAETGNYGIYTYAGGGVTFAPYETATPITFGEEGTGTDTGTGPLAGILGSIQSIFGS